MVVASADDRFNASVTSNIAHSRGFEILFVQATAFATEIMTAFSSPALISFHARPSGRTAVRHAYQLSFGGQTTGVAGGLPMPSGCELQFVPSGRGSRAYSVTETQPEVNLV